MRARTLRRVIAFIFASKSLLQWSSSTNYFLCWGGLDLDDEWDKNIHEQNLNIKVGIFYNKLKQINDICMCGNWRGAFNPSCYMLSPS